MVSHTFRWNYQGTDIKVTGEFDNWSATTNMERTSDGHFIRTIDLPAFSKVYYKFVVDGHWCVDGQALKEGEGAHENNYILTGAHEDGQTTKSLDQTDDQLPVLGHGASYVNEPVPEQPSHEANGITATAQDDFTSSVQTNVDRLEPSNTTAATVGKTSTYDDSGPSPSDPQAVRNARDNPLSEAYSHAIDRLPTRDELSHEVQHVAEVAGGFLAAGLAAGAAALGLSTYQSHTELHPITGRQTTSNSTTHEIESSKTTTSPIPATSASASHQAQVGSVEATAEKVITNEDKSVSDKSSVSQTGSLEQAAVAAATSAATSAYNASGLSGLSGAGVPTSDISKDGKLGFTGIGTAVNAETGVVGSSKIVQGIHDDIPVSDTHTAHLDSATASTLLEHHENGAKVERIGEHTVLAEVGIGGAAIGTAVVTDETVTSTRELSIPAQAAEHLQLAAGDSTAPAAQMPVDPIEDSGLAPALSRDDAPVEVVSKTDVQEAVGASVPQTITTSTSEPVDNAVTKSSEAAPSAVAAVPGRSTSNDVGSSVQALSVPTAATTSKAAGTTPVQAGKSSVAHTTIDEAASSRPVTSATKTSKVSAATTASTKTTDISSAPATPSKAAAQAASKSSVMRQNARSAFNSESTTAPSEDGARKKKGLLKRMKSMFGSKQK
ncbi:protein of unknown function [Taphrina deformans PYCC 5710]|uniref:AMP-activated protein kinase glycogen-binding domain-containing protein n=1 Tax=Taphrina deformans (strain PYCC 5710 / ATCC 11124 / CBS 356.35 / IMI 108563 / JCM 9778 / NBRC 8474) TaxID=1097556 RepID=R4XA90_TAPDE|nr:protein of unknown function [Taphrina deformans PYCC 5710]|eukprot:CCG82718.1 protein of unknown function [Taphrina deformans PYCC 5710]